MLRLERLEKAASVARDYRAAEVRLAAAHAAGRYCGDELQASRRLAIELDRLLLELERGEGSQGSLFLVPSRAMPLFLLLLVFGAVLASPEAKASPPPSGPPGPLPPGPSPLVGGDAFLAGLTPDTRAFVLEVARRARAEGIPIKIVSGRRTCDQQNGLFAQGRTAPGPRVTNARGCLSWHVQGRAVDFLPQPATEAAYARVGAIAVELGGVWGGAFRGFKDLPHLEYHPGLKIEQVCPDPDRC